MDELYFLDPPLFVLGIAIVLINIPACLSDL